MDRARAAWATLCDRRRWRACYRQRARSSLTRILEVAGELPMARALNAQCKPRRRHVLTTSSHEGRFLLHDCLPVAVRRLPTRSVLYQALFRIAEGMVRHMRSACRHTLQKRLLFVHRLLCVASPRPLLAVCPDSSVTMRGGPPCCPWWEELRAVRAEEWLRRFEDLYVPHPRVADGGAPARRRLHPTTFQIYLATLKLLHEDVLGPRADPEDVIPMQSSVTTLGLNDDDDDDEYGEGEDQHDPSPSRRTLLQRLRMRVVSSAPSTGGMTTPPSPTVRSAFCPEEMHRLLDHAHSPRERLVLVLLMTTGLRLGGLCRLRTTCRADWGREIPPDALSTVEKGNRPRTLVLINPVRILLARYFREERPPLSPFVFPAPTRPTDKSVHPTNMWKTLRTVFRRAGVVGPHAHPHTFRHTYVHMMRLLGVETDIIAKLVGHANLRTTDRIYGRFDNDELTALTAGVPLLGGSVATDRVALKERWRDVLRRLNGPYEFSEREWLQLR